MLIKFRPILNLNILNLPDELLINIFKHVKISDWYQLTLVCKRFYNICNTREVCKIFWYNNPIKLHKPLTTGGAGASTLLDCLIVHSGIYLDKYACAVR